MQRKRTARLKPPALPTSIFRVESPLHSEPGRVCNRPFIGAPVRCDLTQARFTAIFRRWGETWSLKSPGTRPARPGSTPSDAARAAMSWPALCTPRWSAIKKKARTRFGPTPPCHLSRELRMRHPRGLRPSSGARPVELWPGTRGPRCAGHRSRQGAAGGGVSRMSTRSRTRA